MAKVQSKEYQEHPVFEMIENAIKFYDSWSFSIMQFSTMGTSSVLNIDTHVYSSMSGTLDSINLVLKNGRINDAYALLRKFHDLIITNVYTNLYLDENHSLQNFTVKKIQDWLQGVDQLPNFRGMTNYIKDSNKTRDLYIALNKDDRYDRIRDRCNNNTHYNFYRNVMLNDNELYNQNRIKYLDTLKYDIDQLVVLHLSYIFYICQHYMISSDHMDFLECGMTPPEDSQYWVAKFIQETFNDTIKKYRPAIAKMIIDNTAMHLE